METEVQGYSRKGKRFLSFDTNLTEPIQSMWVCTCKQNSCKRNSSVWHKWYSLCHHNDFLVQLTCHPAKISMPVFLQHRGYMKFIRKLWRICVVFTVFDCWQLLPYTPEFLLGHPRMHHFTWNVSVTSGHKWSTAWLLRGSYLHVRRMRSSLFKFVQLWYGCRNDNTL